MYLFFLRAGVTVNAHFHTFIFCVIYFRSPPLPITCYHGNCYVDCLEVIRDAKSTKAIKFILVTEGKFTDFITASSIAYC